EQGGWGSLLSASELLDAVPIGPLLKSAILDGPTMSSKQPPEPTRWPASQSQLSTSTSQRLMIRTRTRNCRASKLPNLARREKLGRCSAQAYSTETADCP